MFWLVFAQALFIGIYISGICLIGAFWLRALFDDDIKMTLLWTLIILLWGSAGLAVLVDCQILSTGLICK